MNEPNKRVIVGTRGSALARRQTDLVVSSLRERFPGVEFEILLIETLGDRVQSRPISQFGDKGVFVRALEQALIDERIDLAVHSLKDVPADVSPPELELAAFSHREDPRDCLISAGEVALRDLPDGARVGTGSLRRRVQLQIVRPDLELLDIRGNVDTRLRKLDAGEFDAIVLAAAGLRRLNLVDRIAELLPVDLLTPDAGQGIMAVQGRAGSSPVRIARAIDDRASRTAALTERAAVRALGATCYSPVGAYATVESEQIRLRLMAASEDGSRVVRDEGAGSVADPEGIGRELGQRALLQLNDRNGPDLY